MSIRQLNPILSLIITGKNIKITATWMYGWANKSMKNSGAKIQELKEAKRCDLNNWDYFFPSCIYPFWYKIISVNSLLLTNSNSFKIANILKTAESVRYWTEFCQTKQTKTGVQVQVSIDIELWTWRPKTEWESERIKIYKCNYQSISPIE